MWLEFVIGVNIQEAGTLKVISLSYKFTKRLQVIVFEESKISA